MKKTAFSRLQGLSELLTILSINARKALKRKFPKAFPLAILFMLLTHFAFSQTYTLDWGAAFSPAWSNGTTSGTATNIGSSGVNVTVSVSALGGGTLYSGFPGVNSNNTGNPGSSKQVQGSTDAFEVKADFANKTSQKARITLTFSAPIQSISFGISDIDGDGATPLGYLDSVSVVGTGPGGSVTPNVTKYNSSSTLINIDATNQASANPANGGNATSSAQGSPAQDGTIFVSFPANAVTVVVIDYTTKNHPLVSATPAAEAIAIGNISFSKAIAPVTTNVTNPIIPNGAGQTSVLGLAGTDDESVSTYTIVTLPAASSGILYYSNGSAYVAVMAGQTLSPAQAAGLRFDPAPTYSGNTSFTFTCTDNRALGSNTSTFLIPIEPTPLPTANNITAPLMNNASGQTAIPALQAAVSSGSITAYSIATLPPSTEGVLYFCNSACAAVTAGQSISPSDIGKLKFDPAATFTGNSVFTYNATSNTGAVSNTATYTIPVNNQPPIANPIMSQVLNNTWGQTGIPPLSGADIDGTIGSYTVSTIPSASQGVLYYYNGSAYAPVMAGQSLTLTQASSLKFDPAAAYTGNAVFTYTATDNSSNTSPAAGYTIPVKGSSPINLPPYADNIVAPTMLNSSAATAIPNLVAHDPDGTIASYTVSAIPASSQGVFTYCSNGTEPCTATVTTLASGTTLTSAQMTTLKFAPSSSFTGTVSFSYSAKDNNNNVSNTASYSIPVVNVPPVSNPIVTPTIINTVVQAVLPPLSAHDENSVSSYTIATIPAAAQGILYLCNSACNTVTAGQVINIADIGKLKFTPSSTFTGNASFNYTSTDNNGAVSNAAPYTIPVTNGSIPTGVPPVAYSKTAAAIANTASATALTGLSATDADGTIATYTINSLPSITQGVLTLCNPVCLPVLPGQVISVSDAASLKFTPTLGYSGNVLFDYAATDNSGKMSNVATFTIPVTGVPPVSKNIQATAMAVNGAQAAISSLSATDADGTVAKYTINSLPPASSGILYMCSGTCTAVTAGQVLTAAQGALLQFKPSSSFVGIYTQFNYTAIDNSGNLSNAATYTIPLYVGNVLPVSLVQFGAEKKSNGLVLVSWTSENEINFRNYVLERSLDGDAFAQIALVFANGTAGTKNYSYSDDLSNVAAKKVYYRLKMIDLDGRYGYSRIVSLPLQADNAGLAVTPNPVRAQHVVLQMTLPDAAQATLSVVDNSGRVVYRETRQIARGANAIELLNAKLAAGSYILMVSTPAQNLSQRFIVE